MNMISKVIFTAIASAILPVAASASCPSYAVSGLPINHSSDEVWTPQRHSVIAGGNIDLASCPSVPGHGHIIEHPDFTLYYDAQARGRALEFRVTASCDTVLLVNTATAQWVFSDDDTDLNPRIRVADAPDGRYDIWVGTFAGATCDAVLSVESF
ncbi:MAG: hypothetical protein H6898_02100 [Rhodobacter sp.]|nr:hypothetical protein [Paracoccaceae bacterium]MCC0075364.1 hypothetical protein [Rhodobacter sp.]